MKHRTRGIWAFAAAAALAGAVLAAPAVAGAGGDYEKHDKVWPTLTVAKDVQPDERTPATGPFEVTVTCDYPSEQAQAEGYGEPFVSVLLFNENGVPVSANEGGWQSDGSAWSISGEVLKNKICTADETESQNATAVSYACSWYNEPYEPVEEEAGAADYEHEIEPGCVTDAAVQFSSPWDRWSCSDKEWDETSVDAEGRRRHRTQCEQIGTLTVTNTLPDAEVVPVVKLQPAFTG